MHTLFNNIQTFLKSIILNIKIKVSKYIIFYNKKFQFESVIFALIKNKNQFSISIYLNKKN